MVLKLCSMVGNSRSSDHFPSYEFGIRCGKQLLAEETQWLK
jgi:hypothetical protein